MTLTVVDDPGDRSAFLPELLRTIAGQIAAGRERLLERVAAASDADLAAGTDDDWGLGQIAVHLLVVERGISGISLRLAKGEAAGQTGQPRPAAGSASRERIADLAQKARERLDRLIAEFPAEPNTAATARQPYYGDMNCIAWLLTVPIHYVAHLDAVARGTKSAM